MSPTNNAYGIPMPGDEGVEGFFLVTTTSDAMHVSTNLHPDELIELLDQIEVGLDEGADFERYAPVRPS